jgi:hypothetical protein
VRDVPGLCLRAEWASGRHDYVFRVDRFPRFIVEAKKAAIDITTRGEGEPC